MIRNFSFTLVFLLVTTHAFTPSNCRSCLPPPVRSRMTMTSRAQGQEQQQMTERQQQQPVLVRACCRVLRTGVRCITTLGVGRVEGLSCRVNASSNRALLMGHVSQLLVEFDRLSSPLLSTQRFELRGNDLRLGAAPFLMLAVPVWTTMFASLLLFGRSSRAGRILLARLVRIPLLLYIFGVVVPRLLKVEPDGERKENTFATYSLALSGENLSSRNTLLNMGLKRAMESLLRNSVVGAALSSASAAIQTITTGQNQRKTSAEEQLSKIVAADETQLELMGVTVGDGGRLLLNAAATYSDPTSSTTVGVVPKARVEFVVRVSLTSLDEERFRMSMTDQPSSNSSGREIKVKDDSRPRPDGCGIMITDAELKASFNKETSLGGVIPFEIFGKPIPDIWIPVVSGGIALPFGRQHRVTSIESSQINQDQIITCGAIFFNGDAPVQESSNARWLVPFIGGGPSSSPPQRPSLPGSRTFP